MSQERSIINVARDCPGRLVPVGDPVTIPAGSFVTIVQSLGGNYTVVHQGNMVRVDGVDADALGQKKLELNFTDLDIDQGSGRVDIQMTLTAPGCGMGPVLVGDVEQRVKQVPNVKSAHVELVFDPPWSREMMSEEAQLETGMFF